MTTVQVVVVAVAILLQPWSATVAGMVSAWWWTRKSPLPPMPGVLAEAEDVMGEVMGLARDVLKRQKRDTGDEPWMGPG